MAKEKQKNVPETREVHLALRDLSKRIEQMDFHKTQGKHGSKETAAILTAVWDDSQFKGLVELLGNGVILGELGYRCATRLDVNPSGFYTICDGYGDGNPDGIEIVRDIVAISKKYEAETIKQGLSTFLRYAL